MVCHWKGKHSGLFPTEKNKCQQNLNLREALCLCAFAAEKWEFSAEIFFRFYIIYTNCLSNYKEKTGGA